jgi:energy-coupling factor transporter transmembrane protein EcfT
VGGIARLLRPLRAVGVPVDSVRASLGLALRMVPLVRGEAAAIALVQALRAGAAPRGERQRVEQVLAVAVPLVVCSLERAERTALALEARHYRGLAPADAGFRPAWAGLAAGTALAAWGLLWRA